MKILYLIHGTFNSGGMEKIVLEKANYLAEYGYDISIITTEQKGRENFFYLSKKVKRIDFDINYSDTNDYFFLKVLLYPLKQYKHKRFLVKFLNDNPQDIVISTFGNEVSFVNDLKDGSKKIGEIHFSRFFRSQYNRKGFWGLIDKYRQSRDLEKAKAFDKFVVLTEEDKLYWEGLTNIVVIPNFTLFSNHSALLDNKRAIAVGRLCYQKGYERMIKAWNEIVRYYPDWHLDVYGGGEDKENLVELINNLGLKDNISIFPPVLNIEKEYLNASIYLMTSRYEGLPMVLIEAMMHGLPTVVMDCKCGPRDIVVNGTTGFLVKDGDIADFVNKAILLIECKEQRKLMGASAKERSSKLYLPDRIMPMWIRLFKETILG